jgi:hypothetical protein
MAIEGDMIDLEAISSLFLPFSICLLSVVFSFIAFQLTQIVKIKREALQWNHYIKSQNALEKIRFLKVAELNAILHNQKKIEPIPLDIIKEELEKNNNLEQQLIVILNGYEAIAIGIKLGIYDELVIKTSRCSNMDRTFIKLQNYINHRRSFTSPGTFYEYEMLVLKWRKESITQSMPELESK